MREKHPGTAEWVAKHNENRQRLAILRQMTDDELIKLAERLDEEIARVFKVMGEREKDITIPAQLVVKAAHRDKKLP